MTEHLLDLTPETHLLAVVESILAGRIVPFLGAGANLCGASERAWKGGQGERLPSGKELTSHIASKFHYPAEESTELASDLARVSQYADTIYGRGHLDDELRPLFDGSFPTTPLHVFLSRLPARCRAARHRRTSDELRKHLLIVTTNYDDVMEHAFVEAGEEFHVITYLSNQDRPAFLHLAPDGSSNVITVGTSTDYNKLDNDDHPVILKIHGSVEDDNFVITEDDYIDYLSLGDIASALPAPLKAQLRRSSFLFLGYALHDWNLRAFLRRIWREQQNKNYVSWAVMADCSEFERRYWMRNEVEILTIDLHKYVMRLEDLFQTLSKERRE